MVFFICIKSQSLGLLKMTMNFIYSTNYIGFIEIIIIFVLSFNPNHMQSFRTEFENPVVEKDILDLEKKIYRL